MRRFIVALPLVLLLVPAARADFEEDVRYQGRSLRDWLTDIRQGDQAVRLRASRILRLVGPEAAEANAALLLALKTDDFTVRDRLALALARTGPAQTSVLTAALGLEDEGIAFGASRALAHLGPEAKSAVRHLTRQLGSTNHRLRVLSALALWRVARRGSAIAALKEELKGSDNEQLWAAWALAQCGPDAAPAAADLVALLGQTDESVRRYAFDALQAIGPDAVAPLVKAIDSPRPRLRVEATHALGRFGPDAEAAVPALAELIARPAPGPRAAAARALGHIALPNQTTLTALRKALRDDDRDVRREAARALRALGPHAAGATADLCAALRDDDPPTRRAVADALARLGKPAVAGLIDLIKENDDLVRRQAIDCLRDIGPDATAAFFPLLAVARQPKDPLRRHAVAALGALGAPAVGPLAALLGNDAVRHDAVAALARLGPAAAPARQALTDALAHRDPELRLAILHALGEMGNAAQESAPVLVKLFDEDEALRLAILSALARMPAAAKQWLPAVQRGLKDARPLVRLESLAAGVEAKAAAEDIAACLKDDSSVVRQSAVQVLVLLGETDRVLPVVKQWLTGQDADARRLALELVAWIGPPAKDLREAVAARLAEEKIDERLAACAALVEMDPADTDAIVALVEMLKSGARRPLLFRLLGRCKAGSAPLSWVAARPAEWPSRLEAVRALRAIGPDAWDEAPGLLAMLLALERMPDMEAAEVRDLITLGKGKQIVLHRGRGLDEADLAIQARDAALALLSEGITAMGRLEAVLDRLREQSQAEVFAALASLGPGVVPEVITGLESPLAERRWLAAQVLAVLGPRARLAREALRLALRDGNARVAVEAARALYAVSGDAAAALPVLRAALDAPSPTAARAAGGLAELGSAAASALPALLLAARSHDARLRLEAVRALGRCGGDVQQVRPALERRLRDGSAAVRVAAALALEDVTGLDPLPVLAAVIRQESQVPARLAAVAALAGRGEKAKAALPALRASLHDPAAQVRVAAARAVQQVGGADHDMTETLLAVAVSAPVQADVRASAIRGLADAPTGKRGFYAVADLARDPATPDVVREAAQAALARWR